MMPPLPACTGCGGVMWPWQSGGWLVYADHTERWHSGHRPAIANRRPDPFTNQAHDPTAWRTRLQLVPIEYRDPQKPWDPELYEPWDPLHTHVRVALVAIVVTGIASVGLPALAIAGAIPFVAGTLLCLGLIGLFIARAASAGR